MAWIVTVVPASGSSPVVYHVLTVAQIDDEHLHNKAILSGRIG
jgi:hypothetical protein